MIFRLDFKSIGWRASGATFLAAVAMLAAGCGGSSGDSPSSDSTPTQSSDAGGTRPAAPATAATDPTAAMQEFLDALKAQDANAFCRLTMPDVQRKDFETAEVPAGGGCVESAEAMFAFKAPDDTKPFWEAASHATIGRAELNCGSADSCESAEVEIRDLPAQGGGVASAHVPLTFSQGQWRIGPIP